MNARTATGAQSMPASGFRSLTGPQAQRRAKALACRREKGSECQGQVHVNIFLTALATTRIGLAPMYTGNVAVKRHSVSGTDIATSHDYKM